MKNKFDIGQNHMKWRGFQRPWKKKVKLIFDKNPRKMTPVSNDHDKK